MGYQSPRLLAHLVVWVFEILGGNMFRSNRFSRVGAAPFAVSAIAATLCGLTVFEAQAQLEEVIVTAQKRAQSMQEIGVSVTAFTGDDVRNLGLTNSTDIALQTPGLNIGTPVGEGNNPSITLRGVGLNDFNDNNEGPVALYKDDVYLGNMAGQTFQLFDVERIEVLRGPQGTLYGRNATGGLVHFISAKPTTETEGYADLTVAENNQLKFEGAVGAGLTENVSARLSAAMNKHDGYVTNRIGPDVNEADSRAIRAQINWDISESASLLLNYHWGESDALAPGYQHQATTDVVDFWGYADNDGDPFAGEYDRTGPLNIETSGYSATFKVDFDSFQFVSITAVEEVDKFHQEDTDVGPLPAITPDFAADFEQFSQEFRFSGSTDSIDWVAGAFYYESEVRGDYRLKLDYFGGLINFLNELPESEGGFDGGLGLVGAPFPEDELLTFIDYDVAFDQEVSSWAVFGQADWAITDSLSAIIGVRYTQDDKDYVYTNTVGPASGVLNDFFLEVGVIDPSNRLVFDYRNGGADVVAGNTNSISIDNISGKLGLEWTLSDDTLLFANYARGFKSGGFNAGFMDIDMQVARDAFGVNVQYDEEILDSYEVGFKTEFADGRLRLNATGFYYDYQDFQALTFFGISQFIVNTDAEIIGGELELVAAPTDRLTFNLGLSLVDSEVDEVRDLNTGALLTGNELVLAPNVSFNGLVRYEWPMSSGVLAAQLDFSHQGDHFFDIVNQDIASQDAYTVWNGRVSYLFGRDENFEVSLWGRNLTDEEYRVYTFDFTGPGGFNQQFFAPPRWLGGTFSYRF